MKQVNSNDPVAYGPNSQQAEDEIIARAFEIIYARARKDIKYFTGPDDVKRFLTLANARCADQNRERFGIVFLDSQHGLVEYETMFEGSLTQTSVYPREVVRRALQLNASAVILTHNHPSSNAEPSAADKNLTKLLKDALALVDVRVLDHVITTPGGRCFGFAEAGLI